MSNINSTQTQHWAIPPWRKLVLEALRKHRGSTLGMAEIYTAVEAHPEFEFRSEANKDPRARIRQTLQQLRDQRLLVTESKGRWHVPADLEM